MSPKPKYTTICKTGMKLHGNMKEDIGWEEGKRRCFRENNDTKKI